MLTKFILALALVSVSYAQTVPPRVVREYFLVSNTMVREVLTPIASSFVVRTPFGQCDAYFAIPIPG